MKILLSGASGFIGKALEKTLKKQGEDVFLLSRKKNKKNLYWDPEKGVLDLERLEGFDVVILLNGENIADKRWSFKQKEKILLSRTESTRLLTKAIKQLKKPPKVFLQASATGFYGHVRNKTDESGKKGKSFLADVCDQWEKASEDLPSSVRRVFLRFPVVLGKSGGALKKMLPAFRCFLGAKIGNRKNYISWVSIKDLCGAVNHIIKTPDIQGPVNIVSPNPLGSHEFYRKIAKSLNRPCFIQIPDFFIRVLFGQMGQELFLQSSHIYPKKLVDTKYSFLHCQIEEALTDILED